MQLAGGKAVVAVAVTAIAAAADAAAAAAASAVALSKFVREPPAAAATRDLSQIGSQI